VQDLLEKGLQTYRLSGIDIGVYTLKIESDKFADYCRRAINMSNELGFKRIAPLYTLIEQLEKSADRYAELCSYIPNEKLHCSNELKSLAKEIAGFEMKVYDSFYKFNLNNIAELGRIKEELQKKLDKIYPRCPKEEIKVVSILDRILNLIFDVNGPLMAVYI
jgi:hypothetical protein